MRVLMDEYNDICDCSDNTIDEEDEDEEEDEEENEEVVVETSCTPTNPVLRPIHK
jgi:hypothetical protein